MKNTVFVETEIGGKRLKIETGLLAGQAGGAVTVQLDETILFSAATAAAEPKEGIDYFPLQVEYREKYYAAGKFPGGFFKREARPSEKEILTSRFTDRPIRPLFQKGFNREVQINNMLLSADGQNDPDILSIVAASAALVISDLPFYGPIGAVRVGRVDGKLVFNPTNDERQKSDLDLIYAGLAEQPVMIEGDAREISEKDFFQAMQAAHAEVKKLIDIQLELRRKLGRPDKAIAPDDGAGQSAINNLLETARNAGGDSLLEALTALDRKERASRLKQAKETLKNSLLEKFPEMTDEQFRAMLEELSTELVHKLVLEKQRRLDGRNFDEIRPLAGDVALLPRAHGSALFSRGETQSLATVTLGSQQDSQELDAITGGAPEKKFMVHYNFPPYSTGEVGRLGFTGRREIGHGALAERSLEQMMPSDYGYTVRLVSDIMSSNGSTSMASVCAGALALMDAGVPLKKPVAGISIGLFSAENKSVLVTDIIGAEDHYGEMDFKVAGTRDGITGFQVDLKRRGLPWPLVEEALEKARAARMKILDFMASVIAEPRKDLSPYAPRVHEVKINPEKIGGLIGPGGKNIRRITDLTGAQIDIDDDGTIHIFTNNGDALEMAIREISLVTAEPEVGIIYNGTVTGIKEFGAFVEIFPGTDGLVHISELADFRVGRVEDICKLGDQMWVKCIGIDDRGKIRLSRREAMKEKGLPDPAAQKK
ncbi:MAG: polyribonucleotide nucleotidyltransferase [Kiritimatiellae bacterium]|nr:polyribonucleotide nucleotidyltransferase [Kiritimatiellia bacterium]